MKNNNEKWIESGAKWITMEGCDERTNLYLQFAREFDLSKPEKMTIDITAVSQYMLWINGEYITRGPAVSDLRYYYYDSIEIDASKFRAGKNVIAVLLYHDGDAIHPWQDNGTVQGFEYGKSGLLISAQNNQTKIVTDEQWLVKTSEIYTGFSRVSLWGGYSECYHGEKVTDWQSVTFDRSDWESAYVRADAIDEKYVKELAKLELPPLEVNKIKPVSIVDASNNLASVEIDSNSFPAKYEDQPITIKPGRYGAMPSVTFDFGNMTVGYPEIEVQGAFAVYEIWYGETLDLYKLDCVRKPKDGIWKAFQRRAFRFLKINFVAIEGEVVIKKVSTDNTWYAYDDSGSVISSDNRINEIIDVSKHTLRMNTSYHYEDCPWREQALWIFDMRAMAPINYYYYGDYELVAKNLRQCFAIQNEDGSVNSTGPKRNKCYHIDFCMHLICTLKEYYEYSGDQSLLHELLPYVEKLAAFIDLYKDSDYLVDSQRNDAKCAPFLDWSDKIDKLGKTVILNAVYSRYLNDIAVIYDICGKNSSSLKEAKELNKKSLNNLLYDSKTGLYRDTYFDGKLSERTTFQGNIAAIYGGYIDGDKLESLLNKLSDTDKFPPPFAPAYYFIVFEALAAVGRYDLILEHVYRYWGGMLDRGAVTWWEVFDPDTPEWVYPHPFLGNVPTYEMTWVPISSCHGWSGVCGYAIPKYILGIDFTQIHKGKVVIDPPIKGYFKNFDYKVPLAGGFLELKFKGDGQKYEIELIDKPQNITVEIKD